MVRAFGSDRVRRSLTPGSPSLGKLYHAIHRQKEGGERRRRRRERGGGGGAGGGGGGGGEEEEEEEQRSGERGDKTIEDTSPIVPPSSRSRVSWFIATDDQRSEDRKENRPEEWTAPRQKGEGPDTGGHGSAWFEAYSGRVRPWRDPLRQRQVQEEERSNRVPVVHSNPRRDPDPPAKTTSSGLVRLSLQRTRRLALQAEERRRLRPLLLFSRDGDPPWRRPPNLTGTFRRAVPRKEMVLRSKLIYQKLPEVQCRVEEERRRVEYRSYRLNAQQYNKRITGRVLGRRSAWQ
ncbi:hypothetical protein CRUP_031328 [Coryphaenoides rupestris]|nr:hypothetical protein CRUP_031328 [Coryphaenoides rupestris]